MEQLKPCPFCNSKPQLQRYGLYDYAIGCNSDKCNINPRTPVCDTEEGAVEIWNRREVQTMENKIYKSKCRYCGGNLSMRTHKDLNIIGEHGYSVELVCDGCKNKSSLFTKFVDMIPIFENKLMNLYGKGE